MKIEKVRLRGFTLIELLVVVGIITILAAIAVPNFLGSQMRAKVARAKNDLRVLATAVEAYAVDHNIYPVRTRTPMSSTNPDAFFGLGDLFTRTSEMSVFTSPVAYITTLPEDIFEKNIAGDVEKNPQLRNLRIENNIAPPLDILDYYSPSLVNHVLNASRTGQKYDDDKSFGYMVFSVGPDGVLGNSGDQGHYPRRVNDRTYQNEYDPTNGTVSEGNITRFQKNGATATDAFNIPRSEE